MNWLIDIDVYIDKILQTHIYILNNNGTTANMACLGNSLGF